jgi:uncharacterized protein
VTITTDATAQPIHPHPFQLALALKNPTVMDYDTVCTRLVGGPAPHFPFASTEAYYNWASSWNLLRNVKIPLCSINALDDPMVQHLPEREDEWDDNPFVVMIRPKGGGHLGFYEGWRKRWMVRRVMEWMELFGEVVASGSKPGVELSLDADGWIIDPTWPELGCMECEGGDIIDGSIVW